VANISKEAYDVLLRKYYNCCVSYFKNVCDSTYKAVVDAEHQCHNAKISNGEINRIRFNAFNFVENEHGRAAEAN
jgi:hypothetical protein